MSNYHFRLRPKGNHHFSEILVFEHQSGSITITPSGAPGLQTKSNAISVLFGACPDSASGCNMLPSTNATSHARRLPLVRTSTSSHVPSIRLFRPISRQWVPLRLGLQYRETGILASMCFVPPPVLTPEETTIVRLRSQRYQQPFRGQMERGAPRDEVAYARFYPIDTRIWRSELGGGVLQVPCEELYG
jgi:hypothetical protein